MSVRFAAPVFHDCKIHMRSGEVRPVLADCVQFRPRALSSGRVRPVQADCVQFRPTASMSKRCPKNQNSGRPFAGSEEFMFFESFPVVGR